MRADRLLATLLMLQSRGQVTAAEVAAELEVSERTARRDLEALGMAGVPVYSRQGRNGGWQLLGGARTDLSGLTAPEARALFLVAGPASAATPQVKAALRKLLRALPETFRDDAEAASSAVIVDHAAWGRPSSIRPTPDHLEAVQQAIIEGQQIELAYHPHPRPASLRIAHPLGLASKGPNWYLVADTDAGLRTFRVDRITAVRLTGDPIVRPDGFDLADAWRLITDEVGQQRMRVRARVLVGAEEVPLIRWMFGIRLRIGPAAPDGRIEVDVGGSDERALAGELAGLGAILEVIEPPEIREHLRRISSELGGLYGSVSSPE